MPRAAELDFLTLLGGSLTSETSSKSGGEFVLFASDVVLMFAFGNVPMFVLCFNVMFVLLKWLTCFL